MLEIDKKKILWIDDEIDLLRSHIIFLDGKGYSVTPVTNGDDAISLVKKESFDVILLDEMMPGRDGLSTLSEIKDISPNIPVIMVTKNEEERLMDEAIGQKIDDYLTKPVNPSQILSACKRLLDTHQIREYRLGHDYFADSSQMRSILSGPVTWQDWIKIHLTLTEWDLEMGNFDDSDLNQMHKDQRRECNSEFGKFIEGTYLDWLNSDDRPPLSIDVVRNFVYPLLSEGKQVFFIVLDCVRLDQWLAIEPLLAEFFQIQRHYYYSILPTATPYARNAIFSGLFPCNIAKMYPHVWQAGRDDEQSCNRYEHQLLDAQLKKFGSNIETRYVKVLDISEANRVAKRILSFQSIPLVNMVFNFVDILAHGRSESEILQEIIPDEPAFRSLTLSWFKYSSLFEALRKIASTDSIVVITSDHGSVLGTRAALAFGNRSTSTNLRYKYGNNLNCDRKQAFIIKDPLEYKLPAFSISTNFIIAKEDYYFVYPTKFHEYQKQYNRSFQHGGISLEEMILPITIMRPK